MAVAVVHRIVSASLLAQVVERQLFQIKTAVGIVSHTHGFGGQQCRAFGGGKTMLATLCGTEIDTGCIGNRAPCRSRHHTVGDTPSYTEIHRRRVGLAKIDSHFHIVGQITHFIDSQHFDCRGAQRSQSAQKNVQLFHR